MDLPPKGAEGFHTKSVVASSRVAASGVAHAAVACVKATAGAFAARSDRGRLM